MNDMLINNIKFDSIYNPTTITCYEGDKPLYIVISNNKIKIYKYYKKWIKIEEPDKYRRSTPKDAYGTNIYYETDLNEKKFLELSSKDKIVVINNLLHIKLLNIEIGKLKDTNFGLTDKIFGI